MDTRKYIIAESLLHGLVFPEADSFSKIACEFTSGSRSEMKYYIFCCGQPNYEDPVLDG